MTHPRDWHGAHGPAHLFLALWRYTSGMGRARLAAASVLSTDAHQALAAALLAEDASEAVIAICDVLTAYWVNATNFKAQRVRAALALAAMRAIDDSLLAIHPRSAVPAVRTVPLRLWLEDAREQRTMSGAYATDGSLSLIARGPFSRSPRDGTEELTFVLGNQFAAIKVIDLAQFSEDGRALRITIKVIDQSADHGVPLRRDRMASEVVSFAPLAEAADDLVPKISTDEGTTFIDIEKGTGFDPAARLLAAIAECADSDILVAPELTVEPSDVAAIAAALSTLTGARPRLMVTGSGLVAGDDPVGKLPYNQASVFNGHGTTLWEHRKVAAYAMREGTSRNLSISGAAGASSLMERIHWSDEITIADIDGLGRCLVLICQDFVMEVVGDLLKAFRPDWVLVPIMDSGTSLGRWPARRAREIATLCEARFVVVSSLTMKGWLIKPFAGEEMGVAIGPKYINRGDEGEDMAAVETEVSPESGARRHATIRWRAFGGWRPYT